MKTEKVKWTNTNKRNSRGGVHYNAAEIISEHFQWLCGRKKDKWIYDLLQNKIFWKFKQIVKLKEIKWLDYKILILSLVDKKNIYSFSKEKGGWNKNALQNCFGFCGQYEH
jgi:hypothetical protein